jgi:hypothetical protein
MSREKKFSLSPCREPKCPAVILTFAPLVVAPFHRSDHRMFSVILEQFWKVILYGLSGEGCGSG